MSNAFDTDTESFFIMPTIEIKYTFVYWRGSNRVRMRSIKIESIRVESIQKTHYVMYMGGVAIGYTVYERSFSEGCLDFSDKFGQGREKYILGYVCRDLRAKKFFTQ